MEPAADVRAVNRPPRHHWGRTSASQPIEAEAGRVTTLHRIQKSKIADVLEKNRRTIIARHGL
jgi:hypothetical protein